MDGMDRHKIEEEVAEELSRAAGLRYDARYRVDGYGAVAWTYDGPETVADEDTEWTGYEVPTGRHLFHMVGDDRSFTFDADEVEEIADLDYCAECGQIGCTADGRDRDGA